MIGLLGIPDLGWIVWTIVICVFAIDAGVFFIGWTRAKHHDQRERERALHRPAVPKHFAAIGGVDRDFDRRVDREIRAYKVAKDQREAGERRVAR